MKARHPVLTVLILLGTPVIYAQSSCATNGSNDSPTEGGAGEPPNEDGGLPSFGETGTITGCNPCSDFPAAPIYEHGALSTLGAQFGAPDSGDPSGGPCLTEPQSGTLFPNN